MFLRPSVLNSLMKKAYKSGLKVGQTENGWIYIAGSYWETEIKREFIPKKTMGDLITLIGELPEPGGLIEYTKENSQYMEYATQIDTEPFKETLTVTDVLLIGTGGTIQRLLQDETTGNIYVINNVFIAVTDNNLIDEDNGELRADDLFYNPEYGILWKNNVCRFRAHFRLDEKNNKVLSNLKGVDITPEIPE